MTLSETDGWTLRIRPKRGWLEVDLRELWRYRDLVMLFVRRDFVSLYKQTILGPVWFLIQPLLTTVMFTIIFGNIAKLSTDGIPKMLFYMSGIVGWQYFADCLTKTSETFIQNAAIFGKVYFPRMVMPLSIVISNLLKFGLQFLFLICFLTFFILRGAPVRVTWIAGLLPLIILLMAAMGMGAGLIVSSLTTKYRDLRFLVQFGVQLFMYATPIVYPLSAIPDRYRWLVAANPMTALVEAMRYGLLGTGSVEPRHFAWSVMATLLLFLGGVLLFNRVEKTFMDTV